MNPASSTRRPSDEAPAFAVDPAPQTALQVGNLTAGYGTQPIVRGVSFTANLGSTFVILGDSGCGKTTLLKALAGLIPISDGEIELESRRVERLPPGERGIVYLDQEPLLFEHLSVAENIGFALRLRRAPAQDIERDVRDMLSAIDLLGHEQKRDSQLSGGQKQRVAFARAILARPRLLLLDEPFSNLDAGTRGQMQSLFADLSRRFALTSIFVTHDVKEALIVGDRYARMSHGALTIYADRGAFMSDEATGIPAEISFWKDI